MCTKEQKRNIFTLMGLNDMQVYICIVHKHEGLAIFYNHKYRCTCMITIIIINVDIIIINPWE